MCDRGIEGVQGNTSGLLSERARRAARRAAAQSTTMDLTAAAAGPQGIAEPGQHDEALRELDQVEEDLTAEGQRVEEHVSGDDAGSDAAGLETVHGLQTAFEQSMALTRQAEQQSAEASDMALQQLREVAAQRRRALQEHTRQLELEAARAEVAALDSQLRQAERERAVVASQRAAALAAPLASVTSGAPVAALALGASPPTVSSVATRALGSTTVASAAVASGGTALADHYCPTEKEAASAMALKFNGSSASVSIFLEGWQDLMEGWKAKQGKPVSDWWTNKLVYRSLGESARSMMKGVLIRGKPARDEGTFDEYLAAIASKFQDAASLRKREALQDGSDNKGFTGDGKSAEDFQHWCNEFEAKCGDLGVTDIGRALYRNVDLELRRFVDEQGGSDPEQRLEGGRLNPDLIKRLILRRLNFEGLL
jgi:hypothetical protein